MMQRSGFSFWKNVDVRWNDMDALGHVNNVHYLTYLEAARIHFFELVGLHLLDEHQQGLALVSVSCNYRRQLHYPATVEIGTRLSRIGTSSFHLDHAFFLEGGEDVVADAHSVVVTVDYARQRSMPFPEALRARLQQALASGQ